MPILTTTLWKQISSRTQTSEKKASVICKMSFISLFNKESLTVKESGAWHRRVVWNKYIILLLRCCGGNLSKGTVMMLTCIIVNKKGSVLIVFGTGTLLAIASTEYRIIHSVWIDDVKPQVTAVKWLEAGCGLGMLKGNYVTTVNTFHWFHTRDCEASENNEDTQQTIPLLKSELRKIFTLLTTGMTDIWKTWLNI